MAGTFVIDGLGGKKTLRGSLPVFGEKNTALPLMAAAALISGESRFTNVPDIADVASMKSLLEGMGAYVTHSGSELSVRAEGLSGTVFESALAKSMRASIVLTGPILARMGSVTFPMPGGDVIGARPIDIFLDGFRKLGADVLEIGDTYQLSAANGLQGGEIFFRVVSVTATETFMMAAALAKGPVTLRNAAMEPGVVATADFLKACGAKIRGAGTPTIEIEPSSLQPASEPFKIIPDRIEAATFLALGALAAEELVITGAEPSHMTAVLDAFSRMQVPISIDGNAITVRSPEKLGAIAIRTHEYPGFPTDAQPPVMVALTQAEGESSVIESIFDGRLMYTAELVGMGADIEIMSPHRAIVKGPTPLKARDIVGPDIRAGLAFVLAAAIADGTSHVGNAHLVDRGYQRIEERLKPLGLDISRKV